MKAALLQSIWNYVNVRNGSVSVCIFLLALTLGFILPLCFALPVIFLGGYLSGHFFKKSTWRKLRRSRFFSINLEEFEHDKELPAKVDKCGKSYIDCNPSYSWLNTYIPEDIDVSLDRLLTTVVNEYIYDWYKEISTNKPFLFEVSSCIRIAVAVAVNKIKRINLSSFLCSKVIPIALHHLDCFINAKKKHFTEAQIEKAVLDCYRKHKHVVLEGRAYETRYVEGVTKELLFQIFSKKYTNSNLAINLVKEILSRHLFLPLIDLICDPDIVNQLLIVLFDNEPMKMYEKDHPRLVLILENFVNQYWTGKKEKLEIVRQDDELLFLFMKYIKEEGAIDILQLFMALDEFSSKMLQPELNENQRYQVYQGAVDIHKMYQQLRCYSGSIYDAEISKQMDFVLKEGPERVTKLQKMPAIYRMYENMYNLLEQVFVPKFYDDIMYFCQTFGPVEEPLVKIASIKPATDRAPFQALGNKLKKIKGVLTMGPVDGCLLENEIAEDLTEEYCLEDECIESNEEVAPSYRNLNAWRVSISSVDQRLNCNNKSFFVFIIEVQRIDVQDEDDIDELRWTVERRYHEFYVLESKLFEFHGELTNVKLPVKWFFLGSRGKDFMESRKKVFEQFLQSLLQQPKLKGSNLLFTFLTSLNEFSASFLPDIGFGKMIKTVPRKLVKEKGQHLEIFLNSFMQSTEPVKLKQLVPEAIEEVHHLSHSISYNSIDSFNCHDNLDFYMSFCMKEGQRVKLSGLYDTLLYIGIKVFVLPKWLQDIYIGLGSVVKTGIDAFLSQKLKWFLDEVFVHQRIEKLITIVEEILFIDPPVIRTEEMKLRRAEEALKSLNEFCPSIVTRILGKNGSSEGISNLFDSLQYPVLNRQLLYVLLDVLLIETFPEVFS